MVLLMFAHIAFANKNQAPKNTSVNLSVPVKHIAANKTYLNETET